MVTSSICHNSDDLQTLLAKINVKFNIIGITETRLNKFLSETQVLTHSVATHLR